MSDSAILVLLCYLTGLMPWNIINTFDFISADWKSVKVTRRNGWCHFAVSFLPIPLMLYYIAVFWGAGDYPEACAAILGLQISMVHLVRTSWGLWQLHCFCKWAKKAIGALETIGYEYKLEVAEEDEEEEIVEGSKIQKSRSNAESNTKRSNPTRMTTEDKVGEILVNNTVVDNQVFYGEIRCDLKWKVSDHILPPNGSKRNHNCKKILNMIPLAVYVPLLPLFWIVSDVIHKLRTTFPRLKKVITYAERPCLSQCPIKPVKVWINWSSAFIAQGFTDWLRDFKVAEDPDMASDKYKGKDKDSLYKARRDYFAGQVLAAMCHLNDGENVNLPAISSKEIRVSNTIFNISDRSEQAGESKHSNETQRYEADKSIANEQVIILPNATNSWDYWEDNEAMSSGIFNRINVLKQACASGKCLPFAASQSRIKVREQNRRVESLEGGEGFHGYRDYKRKLRRRVESLPVSFGHTITKLGVEELEWFTVLLYLGWCGLDKKESTSGKSHSHLSRNMHNKDSTKRCNKEYDRANRMGKRLQDIMKTISKIFKGTNVNKSKEQKNKSTNVSKESPRDSEMDSSDDIDESYEQETETNEKCQEFLDQYICREERYPPFKNLMIQLGFQDVATENHDNGTAYWQSDITNNFRRLCAFAFPKRFRFESSMVVSRRNRFALKLGELIDIWSQLEAGRHYQFLLKHDKRWKKDCLGKRADNTNKAVGRTSQKRGEKTMKDSNNYSRIWQMGSISPEGESTDKTDSSLDRTEPLSQSSDIEVEDVEGRESTHILYLCPDGEGQNTDHQKTNSTLRTNQKEVELSRLGYQLGDLDQKNFHLEQTLTFMGYTYEHLRTQLGHWVEKQNEIELKGRWRPTIPESSLGTKIGPLSHRLSNGIKAASGREWFEWKSVQVRLLHEIQQWLQEQLEHDTEIGEGGPTNTKAVMLSILGFPALFVHVDDVEEKREEECKVYHVHNPNGVRNCICTFKNSIEKNNRVKQESKDTDESSGKSIENWKLKVEPQCAPQEFGLSIQFVVRCDGLLDVALQIDSVRESSQDLDASVNVSEKEEDVTEAFEWEWWRDSFHSRLLALCDWQERHEMPFVSCNDAESTIGEGIEFINVMRMNMGTGACIKTWKGWRPFRKLFYRFELESPNFIMEYKRREPLSSSKSLGNVPTDFESALVEEQYVSYEEANWKELINCSVVVAVGMERNSNSSNADIVSEEDWNEDVAYDKAMHLINKIGKENKEQGIILLQQAAIKYESEKCLSKCVKLLSNGEHIQRDLRAVVDLLESFIAGPVKKKKLDEIDKKGSLVESPKNRRKINDKSEIAGRVAKDIARYFSTCDKETRDLFLGIIRFSITYGSKSKSDCKYLRRVVAWVFEILRKWYIRYRQISTFGLLTRMYYDIEVLLISNNIAKVKPDSSSIIDEPVVHIMIQKIKQNNFIPIPTDTEALANLSSPKLPGAFITRSLLFDRWLFIAKSGTLEREFHLMSATAIRYEHGIGGTPRNVVEAIKWYLRAINEVQDVCAYNNLGEMFAQGNGVLPKNLEYAEALYRLAERERYGVAMKNLGLLYLKSNESSSEKNFRRALYWFKRAKRENVGVAMTYIGHMYAEGKGVDRNLQTAVALYKQAITEAHEPLAMYSLGLLYVRGEGIEPNLLAAKRLFTGAIGLGQVKKAMHELAVLHEEGGEGIEEDPHMARYYYEMATKDRSNFHVVPMYRLVRLLIKDVDGVESDIPKAVEYCDRLITDDRLEDTQREQISTLRHLLTSDNADRKAIYEAIEKCDQAMRITESGSKDSDYLHRSLSLPY